MMMFVLITLGFGVMLNIALFAYQKGGEKANVDSDLDSDSLDTRVARNNVNSRKR
ncbi:hypothetical protein IA806_02285 [Listeria seeligeri]|uniref:hypothetical protein n=1 Tax=Listeria seeligeri TaxID=1640 RepID=UPI001888C2F4|nr:hypothetical protein [Listeria seeligeri]MBF2345391.1 hypothetical protein [Listeria seeligeri]